jgi:PilZ domain-containing protein
MSGRDRRIYPRLSPRDLSTPASIRIPNHPPVSLVDLSPGGALIDMPFQMRPDSRVTLEFRAASERMMLPFRMLRCYVTSLGGGVQYQAAGEFEQQLDWKPLLADTEAQATTDRLIATLEAFLRHASPAGRVVEFDHLLMWILNAARRGERADRIAVEIKLRLARLIPSIAVEATMQSSLPDPTRGARFFGFDFRSERALTSSDRRLLRTAAQLLSIVKNNGDRPLRAAPLLDFKPRQHEKSPVIAYSVTDWLKMCETDALMLQHDPWLRTA